MAVFEFSSSGKHEYCCTVVKLKELSPIENSDFLASTLVNGLSIVVRKDECKEGDIMIYASNESALNKEFLSECGLFSDPSLNKDQTKKGFFNKHGRIRLIKLRGTYSYGFLFKPTDLLNWKKGLDLSGIDSLVGQDFDTIDGELFVKAYVPELPARQERPIKANKQFDRIIPGTFSFHYDTTQLAAQFDRIDPNAQVSISVKLHGTSAIFARIPVKTKLKLGLFKRFYYWLTKKPDWTVDYDLIYSSRKVIKNQWEGESYYSTDIWKDVSEVIGPFIPADYTLYGEIVGYETGLSKFIQAGYDYGCLPGEWKFMIYRINSSGREWNVDEVKEWTDNLIERNPELAGRLLPIPILYQGTLEERYGKEDILEKMKKDFGLEELEPLCREKVPREGIVLRVKDDILREAFKLKANLFMARESEQIDKGIVDMELGEGEY